MPHGDLAQVAAVLGAAGSVLVLLARQRALLLVAALIVGALSALALAAVLVRWPVLTPLVLLLAAPFRIPVDLGSQHAFLLLPLYGVLAAAALAFCGRAATSRPREITWVLAAPV